MCLYVLGRLAATLPSLYKRLTHCAVLFYQKLNNLRQLTNVIDFSQLADWIEELLQEKNTDRILIFDNLESSGPFKCISHGDFWCNNMLFRYEEVDGHSKPVECKLIDFQISRIGYPVNDILYFLYSSTVYDVRRKYMTSWLTFYYSALTTALKQLDAEVPDYTFADFMAEYKRRSIMWMFNALSVILMVLDKGTVAGLEESNETKEPVPGIQIN